jgi:polar amino acid transport system substrate-binding protein
VTSTDWSRRDFMKRSGVVAALAGVPTALAGCSRVRETGGIDDIKKRGYVTVGFAGEVPFGYSKDGKITGEAPEVARAVLQAMGIKEMRGSQVSFDALIPSLVKGDFDMIAAGMFITAERCKQILFSDPDYVAPNAFLVPKGNPKQLTTFDSAAKAKAKLGALTGAVEVDFAKKSGVPEDDVKSLADPATAWNELESGRIDAIALTRISLQTLLNQHKGAPFEITQPFFPVVDGKEQKNGGGFGFSKDSKELRDAFNAKLDEFKKQKRIAPIIKPFGFIEKEADDAIPLTAADLGCK